MSETSGQPTKQKPMICRGPSLAAMRRIAQIASLLFFIYLIVRGRGEPALPEGWRLSGAVNPEVLFLANPLTWLLTVFASRTLILKPIWLMMGFVGLTLIFGRVFCGWVCPLGTCFDAAGAALRPRRVELAAMRAAGASRERKVLPSLFTHRTKYYLLFVLTVLACFGVNMVGWFDPLAILMRGTTYSLAPAAQLGLASVVGELQAWPAAAPFAASLRVWLERNLFVAAQPAFAQAWLHLGILVTLLALVRWRRRWWCQYLCPLGAFYGLLGRIAPWRRHLSAVSCTDCGVCGNLCRMGAVEPGAATAVDPAECIRCMECTEVCPRDGISFSFSSLAPSETASIQPVNFSRRSLLGSVAVAATAAPLIRLSSSVAGNASRIADRADEFLLRPPGAREESLFLRMCIRCGECLRVCPRNALHPTLLEAGVEGLWTPRVVPRIGYCEPSCSLCTQVCPTTALLALSPKRKRTEVRLGTARVDRSRCVAWAENLDCGVCEEVCPVAPKAIVMRSGGRGRGAGAERVASPEVVAERCIGCGICENKCPVEGVAAIRVIRRGESRHSVA